MVRYIWHCKYQEEHAAGAAASIELGNQVNEPIEITYPNGVGVKQTTGGKFPAECPGPYPSALVFSLRAAHTYPPGFGKEYSHPSKTTNFTRHCDDDARRKKPVCLK